MRRRALGLAAVALAATATPAGACVTLSDEMEARIAEAHSRARMDADVIVIGVWHDLSVTDDSCGRSEDGSNPCKASVESEKVIRGVKLAGFPVRYDHFVNMCDPRSNAPADGDYGKFYLARTDDGTEFSMVEFVGRERKRQ